MGKAVLKYIFAFCSLLLVISCGKISSDSTNDEVDYSDSKCWFEANQEGMNKKVDIFYVVPTCIWDYTYSLGQIQHNMDIFNTKQRQMVDPSIRLAKNILSDSCNFFSPYYRQISMDSWLSLDTALIEKRFQLAYKDVVAAFRYYWNNYNQGRPFILAGHSQGAKAVIELLKHEITPEIYQHLVASYAIGYTITQEELDSYPYLRMAKDSTDVGVIIGFNSVTKPEAISPLFKNNIVCINPLNWKTDASPGVSYQGFTASIDPSIHTIVVTGIDEDKYYIPSVEVLLPKGNLHVEEFNLYNQNLRKNVLQRIRAFHERSFQSNSRSPQMQSSEE